MENFNFYLDIHHERRIFLRLEKREARVFKILFIASIDPDADDEFLLRNWHNWYEIDMEIFITLF